MSNEMAWILWSMIAIAVSLGGGAYIAEQGKHSKVVAWVIAFWIAPVAMRAWVEVLLS